MKATSALSPVLGKVLAKCRHCLVQPWGSSSLQCIFMFELMWACVRTSSWRNTHKKKPYLALCLPPPVKTLGFSFWLKLAETKNEVLSESGRSLCLARLSVTSESCLDKWRQAKEVKNGHFSVLRRNSSSTGCQWRLVFGRRRRENIFYE